jgi:hypothetical protein
MVEIVGNEIDARMIKRDVLAFWNQGPLNRPVQVVPASRRQVFWCQGPITSRRQVVGKPLPEVERILGLRPGELAGGACVYELQRAPTIDEFDLSDSAPAFGSGARWSIRGDASVPARLVARVEAGKLVS